GGCHEGRMQLPDGAAGAARPRGPRHQPGDHRGALRRVPRPELRAGAPAAAHGQRRTPRPQDGPRVLRLQLTVREAATWATSTRTASIPITPSTGRGSLWSCSTAGWVDGERCGQQGAVLAEGFRVIVPDRRGHGRTADVEGPISYAVMADDTIAFMDALGTGPAHVVGWSDGGDVGLLVAIKRPDLVRRLVTIGSNFSADGLTREAAESFKPDTPTSVGPLMPWKMKRDDVDPDRC